MGRPNRLLMLLPLLSLLALAAVVGAQHDHARLMEGLTPREQAVMESVIESMDMKTRVRTHVDDLKKEIEQGWTADGDKSSSPSASSEPTRDDARVAEACKAHASAIHSLTLLPPPPSTPIPPQTFMTLAPGSSSKPSNSILVGWITSLRRRFWKEGYGVDSSRLPGGGGAGGGKKSSKKTAKGEGREEVRGRAAKVLGLLEVATEWGCDDAWGTRGRIALFPPPPLQQNLTLAFEAYSEHARLTGNATAHFILGFFHATGYGETVPIDQGKALLHYTFAALQSHPGAEHALAYKYWAGIGVEEGDCMSALEWYESGAERVFAHFLSGPPGGRSMPPTSTQLSDLAGGAYGVGASWASTGHNAARATVKAGLARAGGETWEDILDYYHYQADRGALEYIVKLGRVHYLGSIYQVPGGIASGPEGVGLVTQSFAMASKYFTRAARQVWPTDKPGSGRRKTKNGKADVEFSNEQLQYAGISAGFLGRMALRGEAQKKDALRARMWFERGMEMGERESYNGLGIIYRDGLGVKADLHKAQEYFQAAADQDLGEAHVNLGKLALGRGEVQLSTHSFHTAVRVGSPFESFYHLGKVYAASARAQAAAGLRPETCGPAVAHLKLVLERGLWKDDIVGEADRAWERGETDRAILGWWMAGERGYESAQNNLAYILDQDTPLYALPWRRFPADPTTAKFSLNQWIRSAAQDNIDSLVKVGDYHFKGLDGSSLPQYEKAAGFYAAAAERQTSALALWNLGYMYENGLGVPQDWHLAKRNYDLALETNPEAAFPVRMALVKLYARSIWASVWGGEEGKKKALSLWGKPEGNKAAGEGVGGHREDGWTIGSVKEGFKKRWSERGEGGEGEREAEGQAGGGGWTGSGEDTRRGDGAGEFDAGDWLGVGGGDDGDEDGDDEAWVETVALFALVGLVALFSWLRGYLTRRRLAAAEAARRARLEPEPIEIDIDTDPRFMELPELGPAYEERDRRIAEIQQWEREEYARRRAVLREREDERERQERERAGVRQEQQQEQGPPWPPLV